MKNKIIKTFGTKYRDMTISLLKEADLRSLIPDPNCRIGIKPNLVNSTPADFGATTHPEVVRGIIEYLQGNGFSDITIAEGSWVGDRTDEAFRYCGYNDIEREYGVRLFDTQKDGYHNVKCGDGVVLAVCDIVDGIDFWINVPVLKGHCQTRITCALKNLKGLIPNKEKRRFHTMGLHTPIAYLQRAINQDFIVVDHICGDLDFEEGGNPVVKNCIMAARDPVLVDSYVCHLLGYELEEVPYILRAEELGIGSTVWEEGDIVSMDSGEGSGGTYVEDMERRILDVSYAVDEVDSCSACYANLTGALIRLKEEGLLDSLNDRIGIGQGMKNKSGRLGIGACTSGFDYSIPGCPPDEETVYDYIRNYIKSDLNNSLS